MAYQPPAELWPVENVFESWLPNFVCFGCSSKNTFGLGLNIKSDTDKKIHATLVPRPEHSSFPGVVHGGIIGTVMDDVAFWTQFLSLRNLAVTKTCTVNYKKPLFIGEVLTGVGEIVKREEKTVTVSVIVYNAKGEEAANGTFVWSFVPKAVMEKMLKMKIPEIPESKL